MIPGKSWWMYVLVQMRSRRQSKADVKLKRADYTGVSNVARV
jgi:hypothetical protein